MLSDYFHHLRTWKRQYAPQQPEDEWHPLFVEALQRESHIEYLLDVLLYGTAEEKKALVAEQRKEVMNLEQRFAEHPDTDGVILVAVRDNGNGFFNLLFAGQSVLILQIEHEIIEIRVVQGRCGLLPPEGLYNINALRQNVVADSTLQIGVVLKHGQAVPYAVSDSSVIGQVQTSPDFLHGWRTISPFPMTHGKSRPSDPR